MTRLMIAFAITMWCVFGTSSARAESPVWKISKEDQTLYIGGTIHMLVPADYPLPEAFSAAYESSETIVFETDMAEAKKPESQQKIMSTLSYRDGKTLVDDISPETLKALEAYCAERGVPLEAFVNLKTGILVSVLTVVELQRLGLLGTGVDEFYSLRAIDDKKALGQFESFDEQITFLAKMGEGNEDQLIMYTLKDMEKLPENMSKMKAAWRVGDMKALAELALDPLKKDFPGVFKLIVVDRNNEWMPDIESMLATPEVEFVLVGALHLAGEIGLLEQLRRKGYTVTKQ